ncbi:hypothetical protein ACFU99_34585 [Streptomyces sp. NPDC057654]|uniref:hypothetical protein n=1 Tax=Streptomyces sp. NPDC057654 TaxID=3346196 RepID=UPI0036B4541D
MGTMDKGGIVIGLVIVALVIRGQLRTRPVHAKGPVIVLGVLGVLGIAACAFGVASVVKYHPLGAATIALTAASLAIAAGFGAARARTVRVWRAPEGQALRQGTVATMVLWLVSVAVHIGMDRWIDHTTGVGLLGFSTLYLCLAVTLAVQNLFVRRRAAAVV